MSLPDRPRRWKRQKVKLEEVIAFRATPGDRLEGLELAEAIDVTESELARQAWLIGIETMKMRRRQA